VNVPDGQARHRTLLALAPELADELRPGELLVHVERVRRVLPHRPMSAVRALEELTPQAGRVPLGRSGPVVAAGSVPRDEPGTQVPGYLRLYEALFGRDSLTCARILYPWYPGLARRTVLALAELQGLRDDVASEEEPGRIPHEVRAPDDPIARRITAERGWAWPYYGSIDATCLWIMLVARIGTGDAGFLATPVTRRDGSTVSLARCLADAVDWLLRRLSGSGLLESRPRFAGSLENQGWKDSWDAYSHADGTLARTGTIAGVEVQGLAHDALQAAAALPDRPVGAGRLRRAADDLRERILLDFWVGGTDSGFFALGMDRDERDRPRRLEVESSNMGHLLLGGVLDGDDPMIRRRRRLLMAELASPDMLCAAGIRTLSERAARFRPNAYHNGTSWPWDTYIVAAGLRRHGAQAEADDLARRILAGYLATRHFPEFYSGDDAPVPQVTELVADVVDRTGRRNRICRPPQEVQAWTAAAVLAVKRRGWPTGSRPGRTLEHRPPTSR
jgi:glycogen debranching enzyme